MIDIWFTNLVSLQKNVHRHHVTQRSIERSIFNFKRKDKIKNIYLQKMTELDDILNDVKTLKRAGHVARLTDDRWISLSNRGKR